MDEVKEEVKEEKVEATPEPTEAEEFIAGAEEEIKGAEEKVDETPEETPEEEKEEEEAAGEEEEEEIDWKARGEEAEAKIAEMEKELAKKKETAEKEPEKKEFVPLEMPEEVKALFEDYPDMEKAINHVISNEAGRQIAEIFGSADVEELKQQIKDLQVFLDDTNYVMNFESVVLGGYYDEKGEFVEGHPDSRKIARTPEWKEWIEAKTKKDPSYAAPEGPQQAINIISEYKTDMAKKAAKEHDKKLAAEAKKTKGTISDTVETGKAGGTPTPKEDKDDYLAGFQEEL